MKSIKLTREDAQEVMHKLTTLSESEDLIEDYGLTQAQADALRDSVPHDAGEWIVPEWGVEAARGEMADHCRVLDHIAQDARASGEVGQSLRIAKQSKRLAALF